MKNEAEEVGSSAEDLGADSFAVIDVESEPLFLTEVKPTSPAAIEFLRRVAARTGGDKHMRVIVYCAGRHREASTHAARLLAENGYTDIREYRAGQEIRHASPIAGGDARGTPRSTGASHASADETPSKGAGT
jgi:hypothetical protein